MIIKWDVRKHKYISLFFVSDFFPLSAKFSTPGLLVMGVRSQLKSASLATTQTRPGVRLNYLYISFYIEVIKREMVFLPNFLPCDSESLDLSSLTNCLCFFSHGRFVREAKGEALCVYFVMLNLVFLLFFLYCSCPGRNVTVQP